VSDIFTFTFYVAMTYWENLQQKYSWVEGWFILLIWAEYFWVKGPKLDKWKLKYLLVGFCGVFFHVWRINHGVGYFMYFLKSIYFIDFIINWTNAVNFKPWHADSIVIVGSWSPFLLPMFTFLVTKWMYIRIHKKNCLISSRNYKTKNYGFALFVLFFVFVF
jgi:hypothetical protein